MNSIKIVNANIINEGKIYASDVFIRDGFIDRIDRNLGAISSDILIDAKGKYLLPGVIDDQVHFREPGLTHKGDLYSESRAAVAGGITSFMEMPNTVPQAVTQSLLEEKYQIGKRKSLANYSFYMGATNDNLDELLLTDQKNVCGIKVFMGSSTGNMLVDNLRSLENIFAQVPILIATHCEDETTIKNNTAAYQKKYGDDIPMDMHPKIRSEEACYLSSSLAVDLAGKFNTRLHVLHISTSRETHLFNNKIPLTDKRITSEACIHHLWFDDRDYREKGSLIKWNPAVKGEDDKKEILNAVISDKIDVIATDHAPHTKEEKRNKYLQCPSGGPLVQHTLVAMMELHRQGKISLETIVEKMCHNPAIIFNIEKRGFIREGFWADLVVVDPDDPWLVDESNILYKCKWSPFEGYTFNSKVLHTIVSGHLAYSNGRFDNSLAGKRLSFDRI